MHSEAWEACVRHLQNGDKSNCFLGLLAGVNETMCVKCLEKGHAPSKCSVLVYFYQ